MTEAVVLLMAVFPMVPELLYAKALMLGIVAGSTVLRSIQRGRLSLAPETAVMTLVIGGFSSIFVIQGLRTGAPGAVQQGLVYVLWSLTYAIIVSGLSRAALERLSGTLVAATISLNVIGTGYVAARMGWLPPWAAWPATLLSQGEAFTFRSGLPTFSIYGLNSMPFLLPFVFAFVSVNNATSMPRFKRAGLWGVALWAMILAVASGRRGLWVTCLLAPLITNVLASWLPRRQRRQVIIASTGAFMVLTVALEGAIIWMADGVGDAMTRTSEFVRQSLAINDPALQVRLEQASVLIRAWAEKPLIGAGLGAVATDLIRSESRPWSYELYYLALLFQTGLVGVAVYCVGIGWIVFRGIRMLKLGNEWSKMVLPYLAGMIGFVIISGTNPYLPRFDGLWTLFLPIAVINRWMVTKGRRENES